MAALGRGTVSDVLGRLPQVQAFTEAGSGAPSSPVAASTGSERPVPRLLLATAHGLVLEDCDRRAETTLVRTTASPVDLAFLHSRGVGGDVLGRGQASQARVVWLSEMELNAATLDGRNKTKVRTQSAQSPAHPSLSNLKPDGLFGGINVGLLAFFTGVLQYMLPTYWGASMYFAYLPWRFDGLLEEAKAIEPLFPPEPHLDVPSCRCWCCSLRRWPAPRSAWPSIGWAVPCTGPS